MLCSRKALSALLTRLCHSRCPAALLRRGKYDAGSFDFDSLVLASSVVISSATPGGAIIQASDGATAPMMRIFYGEPSIHSITGLSVTLRGLTFIGSSTQDETAAAIKVEGGILNVEECVFNTNPSSAIAISGGVTTVIASSFASNGLLNSTEGGAFHVACDSAGTAPCSLDIVDSLVEKNKAKQGGAFYMTGFKSLVSLVRTEVRENEAGLAGGALYVDSGKLYLSNQTKVHSNKAPEGKGKASFSVSARINYALPAPLGSFADATYCKLYRLPCNDADCDPETRPPLPDQPCDPEEYGRYLARLPSGPLDDNLPYLCQPGAYGASLEPTEQMTYKCTGPCPAGHYCSVGAITPIPCETGTYCITGSPMEIQCADGTYGTRPKLVDQSECTDCESGGFCMGGRRTICTKNYYNNQTNMWRGSDCLACPEFSQTVGSESTDLSDCTCDDGFAQVPLADGTFKCECEPGYGFYEENLETVPPTPAKW